MSELIEGPNAEKISVKQIVNEKEYINNTVYLLSNTLMLIDCKLIWCIYSPSEHGYLYLTVQEYYPEQVADLKLNPLQAFKTLSVNKTINLEDIEKYKKQILEDIENDDFEYLTYYNIDEIMVSSYWFSVYNQLFGSFNLDHITKLIEDKKKVKQQTVTVIFVFIIVLLLTNLFNYIVRN